MSRTTSITAASGTDFTLTANSSAVASATSNAPYGLRIENGSLTTNGAVSIEGKSGNSDGISIINNGVLKNTGGTLTVTGSSTGNGGGSVYGINMQSGGNIQGTTSAANLKITGSTANQNATSGEAGINLGGTGAVSGAGGTLDLTGYSSSGANSSGVIINNGGSFSGWGKTTITGQNLRASTGNAININSSISSGTNPMVIQSIGGRIQQQSGSITAGQLTIDNTGAGLNSFITDAGASLTAGAAMGGSVNTAGEVVSKGTGKSNSTQHGLNLQGIVNASGAVYFSGETLAANGGTVKGININNVINATGGLTIDAVSDSLTSLTGILSGGTSNAGGLIKKGTGTFLINSANTLKGVTLVQEGTLALNNVNALQASTLDTGTSGSQQVTFVPIGNNTYNIGALQGSDNLAIAGNTISIGANNSSTVYSGAISGTGNLVKVGTGTQTLSGTNIYTGSTTINAGGALQLGSGGTSGSIASSSAITDNGTLIINRSDAFSLNQTLTGSGGLIHAGSGTTTLTLASNGYTGTTAVNAGTLVTGASTIPFFKSSAIVIAAGATFEANVNANTIYSTATTVSGSGTFKKSGSKGLALSSSASAKLNFGSGFTGLLDIQAGAIQGNNLANSLAANASTIHIASGAILDLRGEPAQMKGLTGAGNIINSWDGVYTNPAKTILSGVASANTVTFGVGASASDTFTFSGVIGAAITANDIANLPLTSSQPSGLVAGVASQPTIVAKSGVGTQVLTGTNLYTGTTSVNAGTLQIGDATSTGTLGVGGAVSIASGATLDFKRSNAYAVANAIAGAGQVVQSGAGTTSLNGAVTYTGASTVQSGVLQFTTGSKSSAYAISSGATAEFNVATGTTWDLPTSTISGAGTLKKTGSGTVVWGVAGAGTFSMSAGGLIDVRGYFHWCKQQQRSGLTTNPA
jgi:autotransporter-associated beta strand protein